MKEILDLITEQVVDGFIAAGYDASYGRVSLSNRPDLCEYQCNGAMAAAKEYHKAPIMIANEVVEKLSDNAMFAEISAVNPGFINMKLSYSYVTEYVNAMLHDEKRFGLDEVSSPKVIMIDYGGPNVAKPLHVGHLRSAVIGESLKRISTFMGNEVISDVHLGDWGLQMGLIITELRERKPDLPYFDESYTGEYPEDAPFTISELEDIYPCASKKSKEKDDEGNLSEEAKAFHDAAIQATNELQAGRRGYTALLNHILTISVADLKKNYERLNVSFDLWKGERDAQEYIPAMIESLKNQGLAYESEGALVVDIAEETDTKELPPCIVLKSDGSALYATTDLATLVWRVADYHPNQVIYVADKRQDLHFTQFFRVAKKGGIVPAETDLSFIGFGTMNGKDGKPFKTRDGGVMRLENLLGDVEEEMYAKILENQKTKQDISYDEEEARETAKKIALSAIKYGDLSNQSSKDYIFDIDRFTSFEGNTGPYILYTIVRIKSILNKYYASASNDSEGDILLCDSDCEKELMLVLGRFNSAIRSAYEEMAPHKICAYIYELANAFNHFYHETKILGQEDAALTASYIRLLTLTKNVLEQSIDLLGFSAPKRM